ncbi:Beta-N-acetylhexosaminidase [Durusdinium trenchii]|uniref:Beta-N-acetylhexosaminidase n=1 Tax=Durusdinium trenchii TaxID=1381693 RepID=A0ABP0IMB2_9DINO
MDVPVRLPPSPNDQARPSVRMEGRYLQDTAVKLGDDASYDLEKATERSMMSTPPTITPPKSRLSSNREDEKLMRSSFLAEASDCIRSLQAVFQSANASTCFSRLDDWRRTDLRATAQMQQHVKTLQSLNNSVAEFLQRCSAVETFQDFHSTMDRLSEAVCEMRDFRSEFTSTIDTIAKGVADRVLASLSKDAEERSAWLHCQLEKHGEVQESLAATQRKIWHRLESMGRSMEQQLKETQRRSDQVEKLEEVQKEVQQDCRTLLELQHSVFKTFENSSEQQGALQDNIFSTISQEMQSMNGYIFQSLGWSPETPAVTESLHSLEARLMEWHSQTLHEAESLRQELARSELTLRENERAIAEAHLLREECLSQQAALKEDVQHLETSLEQVSSELKDAQMVSMLNSMKRLRDIELRGNVKVDRQSGRITAVKALDFLPAAPPKEKGPFPVTFASETEAEKVLADLLEVVMMFDAPLQITVGCKQGRGDAGMWQEMVTKRASLVKEHLVRCGRSEEDISITGSMVAPEFYAQLQDTKIFPPAPPPPLPNKGRSKSPNRRR